MAFRTGSLTELLQLTAASSEDRIDFLKLLGPDFATLLLPTVSPLHIRFAPGLAPLAQRLRDALKQFEGRITTGTQNAAAGASASEKRAGDGSAPR